MVKIPSFDDIKKAGTNLVDSAKSGALVDKLKSGVESLGASLAKSETSGMSSTSSSDNLNASVSGSSEIPPGTDPIQNQFRILYALVADLQQAHAQQASLIKKVETQLGVLSSAVTSAKP